VAKADDGATNATATGKATAINNSSASNDNKAIAEGTFDETTIVAIDPDASGGDDCDPGEEGTAACFGQTTTTHGASAVATGDAIAVNNSNAKQSATAIATNGTANASANALACVTPVTFEPNGSGCDSTANSKAIADKGTAVSIADAVSLNGGTAYANSEQTAIGDGTATAAAGGAAIAVAEGANNTAIRTRLVPRARAARRLPAPFPARP
jgi:hypothetical protein